LDKGYNQAVTDLNQYIRNQHILNNNSPAQEFNCSNATGGICVSPLGCSVY